MRLSNEDSKTIMEFLQFIEEREPFENPAHQRQVIGNLWYALGYRIIGGVPVPTGEEVKIRMGDMDPYAGYRRAWEEQLAALNEEQNHEALSRQADDEDEAEG